MAEIIHLNHWLAPPPAANAEGAAMPPPPAAAPRRAGTIRGRTAFRSHHGHDLTACSTPSGDFLLEEELADGRFCLLLTPRELAALARLYCPRDMLAAG